MPPPAGRLPAGSSGGFPSRFMRGAETEIPRRATCAERYRAGIQRRDAMFTLRRRNLSSVYTSASSRPVLRDFTSGSVRDFRNTARRFANYFVCREHVARNDSSCYPHHKTIFNYYSSQQCLLYSYNSYNLH